VPPAPYWTYLKSPQTNFWRRLYNFLCLKLWGHWNKSHQLSTRCTEMIADYSAAIKIAIFQSIWKRQRHEWRLSSNCGWIVAKIVRFNRVNCKIAGRKFTRFGHGLIIAIEVFESGFTFFDQPFVVECIKRKWLNSHRSLPPTICWSVCLSVCLSSVLWQNSWSDMDAIWDRRSDGPRILGFEDQSTRGNLVAIT